MPTVFLNAFVEIDAQIHGRRDQNGSPGTDYIGNDRTKRVDLAQKENRIRIAPSAEVRGRAQFIILPGAIDATHLELWTDYSHPS
jgi:hypothetical protein